MKINLDLPLKKSIVFIHTIYLDNKIFKKSHFFNLIFQPYYLPHLL